MRLNSDAIIALKKATAYDTAFRAHQMSSIEATNILNKLLTDPYFFSFIKSLKDLDEVYSSENSPNETWNTLTTKFGNQLICEALEHMDDCEEAGDHSRHELYAAICAVKEAMDNDYLANVKKETHSDVFRYRLQQSYLALINNMYPNK